MKINIKYLSLCTILGTVSMISTSCNDLLDLDPVSQITPESYYNNADQLASYLNSYYDGFLQLPFNGGMYHDVNVWNDGLARSDRNTDIFVQDVNGNTRIFSNGHWEVPAGKSLQGYYGNFRICNYFLERVIPAYEAKKISGDDVLIRNYIGEAYFLRAVNYFNTMARFGDLPIVTTVLEDNDAAIIEASKRAPRNEVARFILADLDKAIGFLADRGKFKGQRINKETALLFKSRVALFEGTFEKYHKGSGRVPGDANWPGAKMAYNSGKSFDIDAEVSFFLTEAMNAAKQVADKAELTENTHTMNPANGTVYGWNGYFEMYSQPSLANVPEVLLWKEYSSAQNIKNDVPHRVKIGCADGYTRVFVETFLTKKGLPIYADDTYKGDVSIDDAKAGRDERLQLFVWGESNMLDSDPKAPTAGTAFTKPDITTSVSEKRAITGYQPRKYYTYDYNQTENDERRGTNACPIFRSAEALLNYMEASYELNKSLDATAKGYWQKLRARAGVSTDIDATIAATDLTKENDFAVYSGTAMIDKTLYNIRRERMAELFSEGQRFPDLIRWRAFDRMITTKWIPEGVNFWTETYKKYGDLKADGSAEAIVSSKDLSIYLRPYSRSMQSTNELRDGYNWHEAYYLYPIGNEDLRLASPDKKIETSNLYQNIYWPTTGGAHAEK